MDKIYDFKNQENKIYDYWEENKLFSPESASEIKKEMLISKKPYAVCMPPPNANASLHCGHATYAIQDLMVRFKRMQGYDAIILPGTDHAGFETQVVYERTLKKEGKSRFDFDRETLYNDILNFVKMNSDVAISQLKKLGIGADWDRNTFMLDQKVIDTVYDTFIKMHKDGYVYRSGYMVNFSTFHGTTFSDLETQYKDSVSPLYYVKYKIKSSDKYITVATVRPETIYADVAIAVNPDDSRYKDLIGSIAINPLNNKEMKIIGDAYVDVEFGTGALKITPGHDFNDYEIGKKHGLETISVISLSGQMINTGDDSIDGLYPKQARIKVGEILLGNGSLEKIDEKYENRVLVDYKDQSPIEPLVIPNWFINMEKLSDLAIDAVEKNKVKFYLPRWKKEVLRWLKEKRPWPISRQTVFGIRIPAWYSVLGNESKITVSFIDKKGTKKLGTLFNGTIAYLISTEGFSLDEIKEGLQKVYVTEDVIPVVQKDCPGDLFVQETDTFDTWFSSAQWPLTTTNYPNGEEFKKYFPTAFLDTMWDILFFWVARMIMMSLYLTGEVPFKLVYLHGAITDKSGAKMSKSKGNVINPMDFVEKYGADALRMGIIVGGNTSSKLTPLDEDKVRGYRNFSNKIWNIGRYVDGKMKDSTLIDVSKISAFSDKADIELLSDLNKLVEEVTLSIEKYNFKNAGELTYQFIWDRLANGYLESIKDRNDANAISVLKYAFETSLKLLHPYMPFITEAMWKELGYKSSIMMSDWPQILK